MTLLPEDRLLLTDALRPPDGYAVDIAVATTYSLDLTSLLLAPMAMAAYDQNSADIDQVNALALLESLRRHANRTTVFCQAGGIHIPAKHHRLGVFAEESVVEVSPPQHGKVFHPKIWVLRFTAPDAPAHHRLVCLSRNLTGDRSWDTVLVCDEDPDALHHLDPEPLAQFLTELLTLTTRPIADDRRAQVEDLSVSVAGARLAVPHPFTSAELLPLGTVSGGSWPLPARVDALLVISPFLDHGALNRLPATDDAIIVSRAETIDRLGGRAFERFSKVMVLQPIAEGAEPDEESPSSPPPGVVHSGLHAKVLAWDSGTTGHLVTGSPNCTGAAFGGNVEFAVHLSGPLAECGATAVLKDSKDRPGLVRMLQSYAAAQDGAVEDPGYALEQEIESFHADLAGAAPRLLVTPNGDRFDVALSLTLKDPSVGASVVWPVSLGRTVANRPLSPLPRWPAISLAGLTPFLAVETTLERDGVRVTRGCVLTAELEGAPSDRANQVLRELLAREEDVLRYLALLLSDPRMDAMIQGLFEDDLSGEGGEEEHRAGRTWSFDDLVLLEPLVRASARNDSALQRVHDLFNELRDPDGQLPQLSEEFQSLWEVVWAARTTP